jgi:ADP-ribosylglycohydrolase
MPYFQELHDLLNEVTLWADLRHEQQADIRAVIKRLHRELKSARKALRKAEPKRKALETEPNGLDEIRALRPEGPRRLWSKLEMAGLSDRLKGAWLGRAAGCTLGAPVEGWPIDAMENLALTNRCGMISHQHAPETRNPKPETLRMAFPPTDYWTAHPSPEVVRYGKSAVRDYLRGHISAVPVDDDITYTVLGLLILEEFGPDFTTEQVGEAWIKYLPVACTAEEVALRNLKAGVPAAKAGVKNNPFQEWIGADIRSDPWGYAAPGWPEKAAEFAYRDAYLSHRQNGIYGAMFFAATIAAALALDDPLKAIEAGLTEIPNGCRLAADVRWALDVGPQFADWREARKAVDVRFQGMHPVHTNNNACLTVFGLILGKRDFTKTIGTTVALGLDNDCTAATAGSILGAVIGARGIPEHWWKPFRNKTRTYLNDHEWFANTELVARFMKVAGQVWEKP